MDHGSEPQAQHHRSQGSEDGVGDALHQQLAHELPARRAHRHPYRDLALALHSAREQQVGDIGASNQVHETDRAEEDEQRRTDLPDKGFVQWNQPHPAIGVGLRVLLREARGENAGLGLSLLQGDSWFEASEHVNSR